MELNSNGLGLAVMLNLLMPRAVTLSLLLRGEENRTSDFEQSEPESRREAIYNAVAFLNFVATLSEEDYLKMQDAWDIYFMIYKISCE